MRQSESRSLDHSPTSHHRRSPGFTIVELLVVIVVIAILATISIVAYNGIQNRARTASVASALSQAADDAHPSAKLFAGEALQFIIAELAAIAGKPIVVGKGGLAPWQIRRCTEALMAADVDLTLAQLASSVGLSPLFKICWVAATVRRGNGSAGHSRVVSVPRSDHAGGKRSASTNGSPIHST